MYSTPDPEDEDWQAARSEWGDECIAALRRAFSSPEVADVVQEYVDESEHQDGYRYWDQFESIKEVLSDFELYVNYRGTD